MLTLFPKRLAIKIALLTQFLPEKASGNGSGTNDNVIKLHVFFNESTIPLREYIC